MKKCGIYKITNKINNHSYIGLSVDIEKRITDHFTKAIHPQKQEDIDKVLYKAIRKHGVDNFNWEILELCKKEELKEKEIYYIEKYNTYKDRKHYNCTPGGDYVGDKNVHLGEEHGMAKLSEKDVIKCREFYKQGKRSRDIHNEFFKDKISYGGFLRMWHGQTWKHVMPEVFEFNPHRAKYGEKDRDIIVALFKESGLSLRKFVESEECYVGYGTLHRMINNPKFYDGK
ncbi:MAG: GIY-YIG nuclease family protein [Clostridia bacterium]|nr:GIY-YIG nuclease family protein [Clostridia bacterium]